MTAIIETVFDTESTGLLLPGAVEVEKQPYITDIFCLKIRREGKDIEIIDEYESLVKPPIPIPDEITKITGIDDKTVEFAPAFVEIARPLAEFHVGVHSMIAHNLAYDRSMLVNELFRCDRVLKFPWPINHICTVEKTMFIEQRRMSLTRLLKDLLDREFPDAHRAKPDVMALYDCYVELARRELI